ncbi:MAG TPA: ACT domain-containing protein [Hanamia sp.]|nr:ACT domain-containing protein [Hanamia sp.]
MIKPKYKVIIVIQCSDKVGLVAAISNLLAKNAINIISMREHVDTVNSGRSRAMCYW